MAGNLSISLQNGPAVCEQLSFEGALLALTGHHDQSAPVCKIDDAAFLEILLLWKARSLFDPGGLDCTVLACSYHVAAGKCVTATVASTGILMRPMAAVVLFAELLALRLHIAWLYSLPFALASRCICPLSNWKNRKKADRHALLQAASKSQFLHA